MANPMREIILRAWTDPAFKKRLMSSPIEVFKESGIEVRDHIKSIRVVENSGGEAYFILPEAPNVTNLSDADIKKMIATAMGEQLILPTIW